MLHSLPFCLAIGSLHKPLRESILMEKNCGSSKSRFSSGEILRANCNVPSMAIAPTFATWFVVMKWVPPVACNLNFIHPRRHCRLALPSFVPTDLLEDVLPWVAWRWMAVFEYPNTKLGLRWGNGGEIVSTSGSTIFWQALVRNFLLSRNGVWFYQALLSPSLEVLRCNCQFLAWLWWSSLLVSPTHSKYLCRQYEYCGNIRSLWNWWPGHPRLWEPMVSACFFPSSRSNAAQAMRRAA